MNDLRDTCQGDRAADRAASAARTLATIANDAARKYVQRDRVAPQADGAHVNVVPRFWPMFLNPVPPVTAETVDTAERERQARLRRWHEPPHPNRKDR